MLSGTVPFKAGNMADLHKLILKGTYNPIKDISEEAMNLLKGLLELDPKRRLTAEQILNHPWIRMNNDNGKSKSKSILT
jgi:serine/threonine protein kinase